MSSRTHGRKAHRRRRTPGVHYKSAAIPYEGYDTRVLGRPCTDCPAAAGQSCLRMGDAYPDHKAGDALPNPHTGRVLAARAAERLRVTQ